MPHILDDLRWRGLIHQTTDDQQLTSWLGEKARTVYAGFDPTAESLHVGSLMPLLLLRRFQRHGHRPIALVGGSTGMIGDPSGKSEERNLLSTEVIEANIRGMERQMRQFLDFDCGPLSAQLVNNYEWMSRFSFLDFLREVGKHVPVSVMLSKDSVHARLERGDGGLSFTEFSYMLLQAHDFVHLAREQDCQLQVGGSDQWGNITSGIDLGRRMHGLRLYGLTCPLLTKSDGSKMGKTETGAIWLSADRTSPYAFYQYFINVADEDAGRCLRFLTELSREEIEALDQSRRDEPHLRGSQKALAEHMTRMVHGLAGLQQAQRATEIFFGAEIEDLSDQVLQEIFADVPNQTVPRQRLLDTGMPVVDALLEAGLYASKGEARRGIQQGGAYVNNRRIESAEILLTEANLASETVMVLRSGKKKYALLRFPPV